MTQLSVDLPLIRNPDLIAADMDGETVMMSIERGAYFGLGGIGSRLWDLLEQPTSVADMAATICEEYSVDSETCLQDIQGFIAEMMENSLVMAA
jgi:hypothetical protein